MAKIVLAAIGVALLSRGAYGQEATSGMHSCEGLAKLELPGAKILSAQTVAAGAFTPPSNINPQLIGDPSFYKKLSAFCRVVAEATPSADSSIKIEVWMPVHDQNGGGWNGKLQGRGNGGFAGEIAYQQLGIGVSQGYAMAGTDAGHSGSAVEANWALGHPEKVADYGYRGIHEMTRVAKAAVKAYYSKDPQHSYFWGCSNGGRQALMEAQRFPEDYDGILNDPRQCHFDPEAMLCKEGDSEKCLTAAQVTTLKKLYEGPNDAKGRKIFPGYLPGAEEGPGGWEAWIIGPAPGKSLLFAFSGGYFSNFVYGKGDWNYRDASVDQAMKAADEKTARVLNSTEANLTAFKARGGKLILYHGWNDPAISALNTINYYNDVASKMGARETEAFARLYMVPGMQHCSGGPGTDSFR